jgi:hypothetical protein
VFHGLTAAIKGLFTENKSHDRLRGEGCSNACYRSLSCSA